MTKIIITEWLYVITMILIVLGRIKNNILCSNANVESRGGRWMDGCVQCVGSSTRFSAGLVGRCYDE